MSSTKPEVRELGYITIANDKIFVLERKIPAEVVKSWISRLDGLALKTFRYEPDETDIQWGAYAPCEPDAKFAETYNKGGYRMVGYAALRQVDAQHLHFYWAVEVACRGVGLGKLMARFATDLAIRYRNRKITATVDFGHETPLDILEREDFEPSTPIDDRESITGKIVRMTKELRWE